MRTFIGKRYKKIERTCIELRIGVIIQLHRKGGVVNVDLFLDIFYLKHS